MIDGVGTIIADFRCSALGTPVRKDFLRYQSPHADADFTMEGYLSFETIAYTGTSF